MADYCEVYKCKYCKKIFNNKDDIENHLISCLYNLKNKACPTCYNTFWGDQDESNRQFCKFNINDLPNLPNCEKWLDKKRQIIAIKLHEAKCNVIKYNLMLEEYDKNN